MSDWTPEDPGRGDAESLRLRARQLADRVDHAADMTVALGTAVREITDAWTGTGGDSWRARAGETRQSWSTLQRWSEAEREALRRYAATLESIQERARRHHAIIASGESELAALTGDGPSRLDARLLDALSADQNDLIDAARAELAILAEERQQADDACVASVREARTRPQNRTHPLGGPTAGDLAGLQGAGLLGTLAAIDATGLARLAASDPALADRLRAVDPTDIARWWAQLDAASRDALVTGLPAVIGNLDGVAYRDRDRANNLALEREVTRLSHTAHRSDQEEKDLAALRSVVKALGAGMRAVPPRELVSLAVDVNSKAAISVGDLDTASHVTYLVPGMGTRVAENAVGYTSAAVSMRQTQQDLVTDRGGIAAVAWLNYDAPGPTDGIGVANDSLARAGGDRLATDLGGLAAVRGATDHAADVTVVGHSYGTNVAAFAATKTSVDHVVLLGSAGITQAVHSAAELLVPKGEVFASQGIHDGYAPLGQIVSGRQDPTAADFGAHAFTSEATVDDTGRPLQGVTKHGPLAKGASNQDFSYFDENTTAQYSTAKIALGQGASLAEADGPGQRASSQLNHAAESVRESLFRLVGGVEP